MYLAFAIILLAGLPERPLAFIRALRYYWAHRKESPYAATPLAFCTVFILVGMFESVYAPFSVIGCAYFLVQAPLWRAE